MPKNSRAHRVIEKPLDGDPVECGALVLKGTPPSLNNIFVNGKKGRFKSGEYKAWQVRACLQLRKQSGWHVPGRVHIRLAFNRSETRCDIDNLIKPVLDILMASGRIADDRNVWKVEAAFLPGTSGTRIEIRRASGVCSSGEGRCLSDRVSPSDELHKGAAR